MTVSTKDYQPVGASQGSSTTRFGNIAMYLFMVIVIIWLSVLTVENSDRLSMHIFNQDISEPLPPENKTFSIKHDIATKGSLSKDQVSRLTQGKNLSWRFPPDMPFLEALPTCETFKCVRDAHLQPRGEAKYNFPHFIIAGYSKSASTSLYKHLIRHPQVVVPKVKEASLFTDRCSFEGKRMDCPDWRVRQYIQEYLRVKGFSTKSKGQRAVFEATPRIMDLGPVFAETMYELMPWVKLIASMREPISRSISKYVMLWDKFQGGCLAENPLTYCLLKDDTPIMGNPKQSYYSHPLAAWLDNFPTNQLMLIQYEDLVGERQEYELQRLKKFINVDVKGTQDVLDIEDANCRHCRIQPEGWPIKETAYRKLIERVKEDVTELVRLIDRYNLGNGTRWYKNWEKIWNDNLGRCEDGICKVQLS